MWGSRKGESPAFTGSPFPPRLEALKDHHEVLHLLILWSLLSLPPRRPPPPTGLGLPQQALHPPHLISPPALLSAHPLPSLLSGIPLPRVQYSFPHPRQRLGQGWGDPLPQKAGLLEATTVMRKKEGEAVSASLACLTTGSAQNPGIQAPAKSLLPTQASISPKARLSEAGGAAAKSGRSGAHLPGFRIQLHQFLAV